MPKKLLIGLLIDSYQLPNWAYKMLEQIVVGNYAQIMVGIVKNGSGLGGKSEDQSIGDACDTMIYSAMGKLDRALNKCEPDAFEIRQLQHLLPNIPYFTVQPVRKHSHEYFSDTDCEKIADYKLDVLIKLGFGDLRGRVLNCAKFGVWAYQHGDDKRFAGGPPGLWEVVEGCGQTGSLLKILTEDGDETKILGRSSAQTNSLSIGRNNNNNYWKALAFIPRKLRELYEGGEEAFLTRLRQDNQHPVFYSRRVYSRPTKFESLGIIWRLLQRFVSQKVRRWFYFEQYILLFGFNNGKEFCPELTSYAKLIPPPDRFWADPFIVYENNRYYVFIEEYSGEKDKGHISYFTIDNHGDCSVPQKIIERPYHLSYPFVFIYNQEYYMIPETGANKTIELYKCIDFPDQWELVTTLMENIEAYDVTLLRYGGKWWLFANVRENAGTSSFDELFLFYADDLLAGNWTPHARNPIVSDVTSARPAGKIFIHNGNLYRPSQNSAPIYGYGVKINHIVTLTETEYQEECVNEIEPLWDKSIIAVHTLNFVNDLTIIDGLMRRPKYPAAIFRRLRKLWRSAWLRRSDNK